MKKRFSVCAVLVASLIAGMGNTSLSANENYSWADIKRIILNQEEYNSDFDFNKDNKVNVFDFIRIKRNELAKSESQTPAVHYNEYSTEYGSLKQNSYPTFKFDYPDNWKITDKTLTKGHGEFVTLENENGVTIKYSHYDFGKDFRFVGSRVSMNRIEDKSIAPSQFVPSVVNGKDYSGLGEFMVINSKITGTLNMMYDSDFTDIDGAECYAVFPKSEVGKKTYSCLNFSEEYTFYYGGHISFVGYVDDREMTQQEKDEVIAILGSLR